MDKLRDEFTYNSPVCLSPQKRIAPSTARAVGNDLRREAWSRMKPRGTRSSEVAAAEELQKVVRERSRRVTPADIERRTIALFPWEAPPQRAARQ